jgi:hypothetical protein
MGPGPVRSHIASARFGGNDDVLPTGGRDRDNLNVDATTILWLDSGCVATCQGARGRRTNHGGSQGRETRAQMAAIAGARPIWGIAGALSIGVCRQSGGTTQPCLVCSLTCHILPNFCA